MDYDTTLSIVTDIRTALKNGEQVYVLSSDSCLLALGARVYLSGLQCLFYRPTRTHLIWEYVTSGSTILFTASATHNEQGRALTV